MLFWLFAPRPRNSSFLILFLYKCSLRVQLASLDSEQCLNSHVFVQLEETSGQPHAESHQPAEQIDCAINP